jgi:glyoxylase-like metal-dependent hydrolase (beta-lactamase superfamily II)
MVMDHGAPCEALFPTLEQLQARVALVFLTHGHWDHTEGLEALQASLPQPVPVYASAAEHVPVADRLRRDVGDGDQLELGRLKCRVLGTPGHTPGSLSLAIGAHVFTGDALFAGAVGGTASHEDFLRQVEALRSKVLSLGDSISLHPGHGPSTKVWIERIFNPFFQG